jgi:hypothetical protein
MIANASPRPGAVFWLIEARDRKRTLRLIIEDVSLTRTDQIHAHVRPRGGQITSLTVPIPLKAWQARQTRPAALAALDTLLNEHSDGETAALLNAAGRCSGIGKPFTSGIVLDLRRQGADAPAAPESIRSRPSPPIARRLTCRLAARPGADSLAEMKAPRSSTPPRSSAGTTGVRGGPSALRGLFRDKSYRPLRMASRCATPARAFRVRGDGVHMMMRQLGVGPWISTMW